MLARVCNYKSTQYANKWLQISPNPSLITSRIKRNFSTIPTKKPGWRRRRFYRRLTILGIGFTAWYFMVDADLVTFYLDLLRRHNDDRDKFPWNALCALNPMEYIGDSSHNFLNKTVLIIGASSGIGEGIAYNLCSMDEDSPKRIIISARRRNELNRVSAECNKLNPMIDIIVKPMDITDFSIKGSEYNDEFIGNIFDEINGDDIDILILNSGMIQKCRAEYAEMDTFKELADINMYGPIGFTQSIVKEWRFRGYTSSNKKNKKNKKHQIAITSSFVGKIGSPGYAFYSATKHGINGFFDSLRVELQNDMIDFNIMCLGPIMPSKGTHHEMGGKKGIKYKREYNEKYGNILQIDRCAQLYITALKYSLSESWITTNPYLFYMYSRQYIPIIALGPICKIFGKSFVRDVQRTDNYKNI